MAAIFAHTGLEFLAKELTNKVGSVDKRLHLFVNDRNPAAADVLADYTECTLANYASKLLNGANWTVAVVAGIGIAEYPEHTFVFTAGGQTLYGYYVTDAANTTLLWMERFSSSYVPSPTGGSLALTAILEDLLCV